MVSGQAILPDFFLRLFLQSFYQSIVLPDTYYQGISAEVKSYVKCVLCHTTAKLVSWASFTAVEMQALIAVLISNIWVHAAQRVKRTKKHCHIPL